MLWALPISSAFSANGISKEFQCIQKTAPGVEELFPSLKGFKDVIDYAVEKAPAPLRQQFEMAENIRMGLIQQMQASPEVPGKPPYVGGKDANGRETHIFYLNYFPSKDLEDKKLVRERLQALCQQFMGSYPAIVVERCVESYYSRIVDGPSSIEAFTKANESDIMSMAERPPKGNEFWADAAQGKTFKVDSAEMAGNLELGQNMYMPYQFLKRRFGGEPIRATNKAGRPIGILVPIISSGKPQYYFAEARGDAPILEFDEVLWPYHLVFGTDMQDKWNKAFEDRHGGIFVNGMPLEEFIRNHQT